MQHVRDDAVSGGSLSDEPTLVNHPPNGLIIFKRIEKKKERKEKRQSASSFIVKSIGIRKWEENGQLRWMAFHLVAKWKKETEFQMRKHTHTAH